MTLRIDFDSQTQAQLDAATQRLGLTAPEIIKKLVRDYLPPIEAQSTTAIPEVKTLGEIIAEIGFVEGGPRDIARHPEKYMPGFGDTPNRRTPSS